MRQRKKYKYCHGSYASRALPWHELPKEVRIGLERTIAEHQAKEIRRRQQQGLGRSIVSFEADGHRLVAVGNTLYWSKNWKTFHDFLYDYIKDVFGREWGAQEQNKQLKERHILMRWNHEIGEHFAACRATLPKGDVQPLPLTPIARAYLQLAYNLYLIRHNAALQRSLISRLKNRDESSFHGAYYETFVAGAFIKAGFEIAFENEQDGSSSHCEFVATSHTASRQFSVEAKSRFRGSIHADADPATLKLGVRDKLEAALQKAANHPRVIFVDVNVPETRLENNRPSWANSALRETRDLEDTMLAAGQETPRAYVIVTNHPYQFDIGSGMSALMEGFNIPDWKPGTQFPTLRAALDAREFHADMHHLMESMRTHYDIPATFDGAIPELQFQSDKSISPLKIGDRYLVPNAEGVEVPAQLVNATVMEAEKMVYGVYRSNEGKVFIAKGPITEVELEAYKKYPDTFFGVVKYVGKQCKDLIDWYDFFFETYKDTSKKKLLEFMKDADDIQSLEKLSQQDLAKTYCERLAYGIANQEPNMYTG